MAEGLSLKTAVSFDGCSLEHDRDDFQPLLDALWVTPACIDLIHV